MSTSPATIVSVTIRAERHLDRQPGVVFEAYADIDRRAQWIAAPEQGVWYESGDFRAGGSDHFAQGPRDSPVLFGITRYELIVIDDSILFTERLTSDDQLLAVSIVSWSLAPSGPGTVLTITDQTTSVVGSRPIEGARHRYEVMFDRLTNHLAG